MQYSESSVGRIFNLRIDDGEDLIAAIQDVAAREQVDSALVLLLGALRKGSVITGPEQPVIPPVPHPQPFDGGWEVIGIGSLHPGTEGPHLHLHTALGRGDRALAGCLRGRATTYLVAEAVVIELAGCRVKRRTDPSMGISVPHHPSDTARPVR